MWGYPALFLKFDTSPLTLLKKQQDSGYCQHQSYGETISYFCPKICDRCPQLAREGGAQLEVFCSGVRWPFASKNKNVSILKYTKRINIFTLFQYILYIMVSCRCSFNQFTDIPCKKIARAKQNHHKYGSYRCMSDVNEKPIGILSGGFLRNARRSRLMWQCILSGMVNKALQTSSSRRNTLRQSNIALGTPQLYWPPKKS